MNKLLMFLFILTIGNRADLNTYKGTLPELEVIAQRYTKEFSKELIIGFEGIRVEAYPDGNGWSNGVGMKSYEGEKITERIAIERMNILHEKVWDKLLFLYPNMTNSQRAILCSFYWNSWIGKKLDIALKNNDFCSIENMMLQYYKYKGKPNSALLKRRCWELYYLEKTYYDL